MSVRNVSPFRDNSLHLSQQSNHFTHRPTHRRNSSKILAISDLSGVYSEQDKVPSIHTTQQSCTKPRFHKTPLNTNHIDNFDEDHVSLQGIKTATTSITVGIEESEIGSNASYVVLMGGKVRTLNTKLYASLPLQNKFIVKQREQNLFGVTKVRLVMKSSLERLVEYTLL